MSGKRPSTQQNVDSSCSKRSRHDSTLDQKPCTSSEFNSTFTSSPLTSKESGGQTVKSDQPLLLNGVRDLGQYVNSNVFGDLKRMTNAYPIESAEFHERKFKTVMCRLWLLDGFCSFGDECRFAHGDHELRPMPFRNPIIGNPKYKTRPCFNYVEYGVCTYGHRCLFVHKSANEDIKAMVRAQEKLNATQHVQEQTAISSNQPITQIQPTAATFPFAVHNLPMTPAVNALHQSFMNSNQQLPLSFPSILQPNIVQSNPWAPLEVHSPAPSGQLNGRLGEKENGKLNDSCYDDMLNWLECERQKMAGELFEGR
ncbi:Moe-3 [Aphelenchoides besseyi]|nr:Moe-3 [Aphelenchoides besseyi]KAI6193311.1 Moe-3 [Aphelenchoides besseyi]